MLVVNDINDIQEILKPIYQKLDFIIQQMQSGNSAIQKNIYSDEEAADYLRMSVKKLQLLRNTRKIGFIRENGGRKILYRHEHLLEYLAEHELKKKR